MADKIIKILSENDKEPQLRALAEDYSAITFWDKRGSDNNNYEFNIVVPAEYVQALTDKIQTALGSEKGWHILTLKLESIIPRQDDQQDVGGNENAKKLVSGEITREALYETIEQGAKFHTDFIALVVLSTIVAAIGIINDNLAVVIAAMVIAPLLGPNLALSFGVTLGDRGMVAKALQTNAIGFGLTLILSISIGLLIPAHSYVDNIEYLTRIEAGFSAVIVALASGVAAVLSLTSGISSAMVGVMVAVAMMPPAVVFGLTLGSGQLEASYGAALLLGVNIICVNLAAQFVFAFKGIRPRTWYQRKKSEQSIRFSVMFWTLLLLVLMALIFMS